MLDDTNPMSQFTRLSIGLIFIAIWTASTFAQTSEQSVRLPNVQPFVPFLSVNEDPEICSSYKAAWLDIYNSEKGLSERWINMKEIFPEATHIVPNENQGAGGYANAASFEFDYDGDGEMEVLYFESIDRGWRYLGTALYFYDSLAAYEAEEPKLDEASRNHQRKRFTWPGGTKNTTSKTLASYGNLSAARVLQIDGRLYSQSNVTLEGGHAVITSLDWLRPGQAPVPICVMRLSAEPASNTAVPVQPVSLETGHYGVAAALESVYGGPEDGGQICYGTMGWRAPRPNVHWAIINNRPQAMHEGFRRPQITKPIDMSPEADTAREFRYIAWGLKDPTSFEAVKALKTAYPKFVTEYSLYYQIYFDMDERAAAQTAERAYRYLLDRVFYARQTGPQYNRQLSTGIKVGPLTSLQDIATRVVQKEIETKQSKQNNRQYYEALKLGLMAGVQTDLLIELAHKIEPLPDHKLVVPWSSSRNNKRPFILDDLFLASLNNTKLMKYFLELGAEVDVSTNYFGKTALMYAAQNNDLEAVSLLLSQGADFNKTTKHDGSVCQRPLTRDSRSALTYAAEYASPSLILTLLEAGADTAAKDSKDNSISWYLDRNVILSDVQKEQIRQRIGQ